MVKRRTAIARMAAAVAPLRLPDNKEEDMFVLMPSMAMMPSKTVAFRRATTLYARTLRLLSCRIADLIDSNRASNDIEYPLVKRDILQARLIALAVQTAIVQARLIVVACAALVFLVFAGNVSAEPIYYVTPFVSFPGNYSSSGALCELYKSQIQTSYDNVNPGGTTTVSQYPNVVYAPGVPNGDWCVIHWTRTVNGTVSNIDFPMDVYAGGCYPGRMPKPGSGNRPTEPSSCLSYGDREFDKPKICIPCLLAAIVSFDPPLGNPIYPLTGSKRQDVDLGLAIGGQPVKLMYDTVNQVPEASGGLTWLVPPPPSFGLLWHSNLHKTLVLQSTGAIGDPYSSVAIQRGDIRETASVAGSDTCGGSGGSGGNTYVPTADPNEALQFTGTGSAGNLVDGYGLTEEVYDATGAVTTVAQAGGGSLSYAYTTGLLTGVSDQFGRSVIFGYEQPADRSLAQRINLVTAADGTTVQVGYDTSNNLSKLTWADNSARSFVYENAAFPWALTGIVDEGGSRYSTYGYDAQGRANSTLLGTGANHFSVTYSQAPNWSVTQTVVNANFICREHRWQPPVGTQVTKPNLQTSNMGATAANGMVALTSQDQPSGSGASASASAQTYDANGNLASYDDFNGNRACLAYDSTRGLPLVTLEGLAGGASGKACPADIPGYAPSTSDATHPERKTTTVWHPNWVLKAREAAPKKITTWVYNGQPDPIAGTTANCVTPATTLPDGKPLAVLCARYEQATTDATGASGLSATVSGATRAWTYSYNQYGQVLSETTPKQSSTDALSHTTTYAYYSTTSFSGSVGHTMGDLNTITNPLLQVTTFTSYDKAGRLLSSKDANSTVTSMTYWPRGWLHTQTVTPGSGSALTTTYDYWPTGLLKTVTMADASTLNYAYDDAHRLTDITDAAGNKIHYVLDNVGNRTSEKVTDASGLLASTVTRVFDQLNRVQSTTGAMH